MSPKPVLSKVAPTEPKAVAPKVNEGELLDEEQSQLVKNIDVDLKVLTKILR